MSDALRIERSAAVLTLWLNRPTLHNAFDAALIAQLTAALEAAGRDEQVRAVVLAGQGASFSAGADMQWMRGMAAASEDANREDSLALARLMRSTRSVLMPRCGSKRAMRARPASTTARTPGMVREVSATLVATITLRPGLGLTARSCSSGGSSP